jgi:putative spermidine/putrescine transport system ATP-binding protein
MAFLELVNVQKRFATFTAVESFNMNVNKGEFISFLGPSGCGKTTTLRMIAGFEQPTAGQILVDGRDLTPVPVNKRNIGMVFQSYALFPNMNVAGNIGFGLKIAGKPKNEIEERVKEMLGVIHMAEFAGRYPHQLSGGQQQRVALARALAIKPDMLLLDEPLSALDAKIRISLRQEIRAIQRQLGITTIYVTHDQEEALSISDRIVVMNKGRMEQVGTPLEIYNSPQTRFVAQFVGTLNLLTGTMADAQRIHIDRQPLHLDRPHPQRQTGSAVTIALRPESITMSGGKANGHGADGNALNGIVEDVSFLGSVVRVRVRMEDQAVNADTFNNPSLVPPQIGQPMTLHFPPEALMVLRDE